MDKKVKDAALLATFGIGVIVVLFALAIGMCALAFYYKEWVVSHMVVCFSISIGMMLVSAWCGIFTSELNKRSIDKGE